MKTAAKVWIKSSNAKFIWLDGITAENASIEIGNYVEVEKFEPAIAKRAVLIGEELPEHTWIPRIIANE